jgi:hypothetical protein
MDTQQLVPFSDIERMGTAVARSGLFGLKTPEQAIALMLIANAEGLHPAIAARDYDVIQGRPALKAKAKLARFQRAGGKVRWLKSSDTECSAEFSHPSSPEPLAINWDMKRAQLAGLGMKDNWKKYPRQMLRARVISEGVDACYPDAGGLMYVPEEVQDFDEPVHSPAAVDTHAEVVASEPIAAPTVEPKPVPPSKTEPQQLEESKVYRIGGQELHFVWRKAVCVACGAEKKDGKKYRVSVEAGMCYDCHKAGVKAPAAAQEKTEDVNAELPPVDSYGQDLPF